MVLGRIDPLAVIDCPSSEKFGRSEHGNILTLCKSGQENIAQFRRPQPQTVNLRWIYHRHRYPNTIAKLPTTSRPKTRFSNTLQAKPMRPCLKLEERLITLSLLLRAIVRSSKGVCRASVIGLHTSLLYSQTVGWVESGTHGYSCKKGQPLFSVPRHSQLS